MEKTTTMTIRISPEQKEKLEAEARRRRMKTGDNCSVAELIREFADQLPEAKQ